MHQPNFTTEFTIIHVISGESPLNFSLAIICDNLYLKENIHVVLNQISQNFIIFGGKMYKFFKSFSKCPHLSEDCGPQTLLGVGVLDIFCKKKEKKNRPSLKCEHVEKM